MKETPNSDSHKTESSPKMNAFEFMMHSRNRSIGGNSPGREADVSQSTETVTPKEELKNRKSRLEGWAAQKAAKRKREYEEIGECINYKFEKREEKLKKMLKIDCQSDDEVVMKRKKKCTVIDSDSENSNDAKVESPSKKNRKKKENNESIEIEKTPSKRKKKKSRLSLNKKEIDECEEKELLKLTPKSIKSWKFKIKLCIDEHKENVDEDSLKPELKKEETKVENGVKENTECLDDLKEMSKETKPQESNTSESEKIVQNIDQSQISIDELESSKKSNSDYCIVVNEENTERRVLRTRRSLPKMYEDYFLSDEEDSPKNKVKGKNVKVAPVFLKSVPKPKLDPKLIEARRQFLLSGVPSSLKKEMERQQCIEELDFDVFPTISHVQQKTDSKFWDLPKVDLNLTESVGTIEINAHSLKLLNCQDAITRDEIPLKKIKNCKKIITEIKSENPDYPVYKIFNSIYEKSGHKVKTETPAPKRRGRPKKKSPEKQPEVVTLQPNIQALWTEKYKPNSSSDIIGNHNSVVALKDWLSNWLTSKNKRKYSDSESEFDVTDGDSRDSSRMFGNTVILKGPTGSGKTVAVYAVCNELGFEVLEVNASSKRTGKRLQLELQEATQSHQVKENVLSCFLKEKEKPASKMCVLLIEDVDVVFEQDEGFSAALSQIITTSKRPIILTTTDEPLNSIQKVISNHRTIFFHPLSSILTIWLQIVCLVEGLYVDTRSLDELLRYNKGDIRRTLLQLQLYVSSGGQYRRKNLDHCRRISLDHTIKMEDDNSNLDLKLDDSVEVPDVQIHGDCIDSCHLVKHYEFFSLPACCDLEMIWWNLPATLSLEIPENDKIDRHKLKMLSDCYDAVAFADVMCGQSQFCDSLTPKWRTKPKDSLGLEENTSRTNSELNLNVGHTVLKQQIKVYKDTWDNSWSRFNLAVPESSKRRWRAKQHSAENKLEGVLLVNDSLWRKAVTLDYVPALRSMARAEIDRAANNKKRGNRFYSYLKKLGVCGGENGYKMACEIFQTRD